MFRPFITAIMVTGKTPARYPMAMRSVAAFQQQTYLRRRLLIINDHPTEALLPKGFDDPLVTEICVAPQATLGALRNLGIAHAMEAYNSPRRPYGHYLMQWDDDDFSHKQRIEWQLRNTPAGGASLFRWELHAHLQQRKVFANNGRVSRVKGFAGTMCWPAEVKSRFMELGKHEDTEFLLSVRKELGGLTVINNTPKAYLRFYHGRNTWGEKHVMQRKPGSRDCTPAEQKYFDEIYATHYEAIRNAEAG